MPKDVFECEDCGVVYQDPIKYRFFHTDGRLGYCCSACYSFWLDGVLAKDDGKVVPPAEWWQQVLEKEMQNGLESEHGDGSACDVGSYGVGQTEG